MQKLICSSRKVICCERLFSTTAISSSRRRTRLLDQTVKEDSNEQNEQNKPNEPFPDFSSILEYVATGERRVKEKRNDGDFIINKLIKKNERYERREQKKKEMLLNESNIQNEKSKDVVSNVNKVPKLKGHHSFQAFKPVFINRKSDNSSTTKVEKEENKEVKKKPQYSSKPMSKGLKEAKGSKVEFTEEEVKENQYIVDMNADNQYEILNRVMCPYASLTYSKQLRVKERVIDLLVKNFGEKLSKQNPDTLRDRRGLPLYVEPIKAAKNITNYRIIDDFSILDGLSSPKTVGYFVNTHEKLETPEKTIYHKKTHCVDPSNLLICKDSHKLIASEFQKYLQKSSFSAYRKGEGYWRNLLVRSNEKEEHLCMAKINPENLSEDQIVEESNRLKEHFQPLADELKIISFQLQAFKQLLQDRQHSPIYPVFGFPFLNQYFDRSEYRVSPEVYFPSSIEAMSNLLETVNEHVSIERTVGLMEINAGVGLITHQLAHNYRHVFALEPCSQTAENLHFNIEKNKIKNCSIWTQPLTESVAKVCDQLYWPTTVIINYGKSAISPAALEILRKCKYVEKVIYICKRLDHRTLSNIMHLSLQRNEGDKLNGNHFVPIQMSPIDSYPQTAVYEIVLSMYREKKNKSEGKVKKSKKEKVLSPDSV